MANPALLPERSVISFKTNRMPISSEYGQGESLRFYHRRCFCMRTDFSRVFFSLLGLTRALHSCASVAIMTWVTDLHPVQYLVFVQRLEMSTSRSGRMARTTLSSTMSYTMIRLVLNGYSKLSIVGLRIVSSTQDIIKPQAYLCSRITLGSCTTNLKTRKI